MRLEEQAMAAQAVEEKRDAREEHDESRSSPMSEEHERRVLEETWGNAARLLGMAREHQP